MMAGRAVSSVLDVTVCLLLVSASAVTLTHAPTTPDREQPGRADAVLELLTTSTVRIDYASSPSRPDDASNLTAHGTLAGLLAAGTVANATAHGEPIAPSTTGYRRAVAASVRRATARQDVRVQVLVRWRPYPGAHVRGRFAVGPSPPPSVDVDAASATVPWGPSPVRRRAVGVARREGFAGVSRAIADGLVGGPYSSIRTDSTLAGARRAAVASAYGIESGTDEVASERLRRAVERSVEADLRNRFDSPVEAARTVSFGRVRLTVRTWSP